MASWGIFSSGNYAGTDQGVDFSGAGPIPALDSAVVTDVTRAPIVEGGTWPVVVYRLTGGPYKGSYVYTAENFTPLVHKGQALRQGQSIGRAAGRYPYIETGFNKTPQGWNAVAPLGGATAAGAAMKKYIYGLIGQAPPVTVPAGAGGLGTVPTDVSNPVGAVVGAAGGISGTVDFLGKLTSAAFWLRALEVAGGGLLLIMGLYLLARNVGLAQTPAPPPPIKEGADTISDTFSEPPGIDTYKPSNRRSREGVKRRTVSHDVSETGTRRRAIRERASRAQPSEDVPF